MTARNCLGSIHGVGAILSGLQVHDEVSYLIEVWRMQDGLVRTDGIVDLKSDAMDIILQSEDVVLTLETGENIPVIVTGIDSGHAEIRIFGPVSSLAQFHDISYFDVTDRTK